MGAELNPAQRLHSLGQSLWLDSINRVMLRTGALARYVRDLAVTGLTSNPTILGHAMAAGSGYDRSLARLSGEGVTGAQDCGTPWLWRIWPRRHRYSGRSGNAPPAWTGYVSLEVPPDVAYDAAATVALARRLHEQAGFPNLLVKIPGTPQGLTAMQETITAGIGVNVTLLFSDSHYLRTADAYIRALQRRRDAGLDLACRQWPQCLSPAGTQPPTPCCRRRFMACWGWRWHRRPTPPICSCCQTSAGRHSPKPARPQRLLWASTSTKNPDLPDTYYLGRLAVPSTIDTVPEKTLLAFADHGTLDDRLEPDYAAAERAVSAVADAGVDADALAERLQRQGAGAFRADWTALLTAIEEKAQKLKPEASE